MIQGPGNNKSGWHTRHKWLIRVGLVLASLLTGFLGHKYFAESGRTRSIPIAVHLVRPGDAVGAKSLSAYGVGFRFDAPYQLKQVRVFSADDYKTNKSATSLWHLVSDSNSVPTKSFFYGQKISRMKPAVANSRPELLQPDVLYLLLFEAQNAHGRTNFTTRLYGIPSQH